MRGTNNERQELLLLLQAMQLQNREDEVLAVWRMWLAMSEAEQERFDPDNPAHVQRLIRESRLQLNAPLN